MRISKRIPEIVGLVALVFVGACDTLNIANPNDPDRRRALGDANSIPSVAQARSRRGISPRKVASGRISIRP